MLFAEQPHGNDASIKPILLVADANDHLCEVYRLIGASKGFDVRTAADGVQCLNELNVVPPDALIVDLGIPRGGGERVLACLRFGFADRIPPVVVVTGADSPAVLSRRSGLRVRYCFAKPYRPSVLLKSVRDLLAEVALFDMGSGSARGEATVGF